jgi:hypothetical protein
MNMKKKTQGKDRSGILQTLFAAILLTVSASGRAALPEQLELLPQDALELAAEETEAALRLADPSVANGRIELSTESWDSEVEPATRYRRPADQGFSLCRSCEFHLGVGGTYHSFEGTGGVVIPMTVSWDRSRWEFGVFHFSEQTSSDNDENVERLVARPYWGASLSRRFQFFERGPVRAIFGFGVSYRTEQDILSATHWNFSSQFGLRFQSPGFPAIFELSARHWSNGGVKTPNRGQDFTILTVRFDR